MVAYFSLTDQGRPPRGNTGAETGYGAGRVGGAAVEDLERSVPGRGNKRCWSSEVGAQRREGRKHGCGLDPVGPCGSGGRTLFLGVMESLEGFKQ